jgi:transposase-like protein
MSSSSLTPESESKVVREIYQVLTENGLEGLNQAFQTLLNEAMVLERARHLQVAPYERSSERRGHANGFKDKTVLTRSGPLELKIPQVRDSSFYPKALEKGYRTERALKLVLAEMYVQGVSTRKVKKVTEELCGAEISATEVSRVSKLLDEELEKFRHRPLGKYPYVYLDATYQKVRIDKVLRSAAVLVAIGVNEQGQREVLGVSVSISEAETHWKRFLESLVARGLVGVSLIISDNHTGLKAARQAVLSEVPWQRCQFHMAQNAQSYARKQSMRYEIGQAMRDIFGCPSVEDARDMVQKVIKRYESSASDFVDWLEENVEEAFTIYQFPRAHWKKLRTTNPLERVNREIRRRTRVATLFLNEDSCLRLVTAVLQEIHEEWLTGNVYLPMKEI